MAKTAQARTKKNQKTAMATKSSKESAEELYASALELVEQGQREDALRQAKQLWSLVKDRGPDQALPALNLLGEISVELGAPDAARGYFENAVALDPEGSLPEAKGGGAEKFLWLAQLCEEGGQQSVHWFERGVKALQFEIAALEGGKITGIDEESLLLMRMEKKRRLANALCGIVEVYMTDLSWEDDAEARCESLITEAVSVEEETSAEVLQTLASVRLSQQRQDDARSALKQSIQIWQGLDPEDPEIPDFATRVSLARLLMEAEMEQEALDVLSRLVQEDDQSIESWYLGGWCQHLLAGHVERNMETDRASAETGETSEKSKAQDSLMKGSRRWLIMAIKLYDVLEYEDQRLLEHARELVTELDAVLGPEAEDGEGRGDESEEEWQGFEDDADVDAEMVDA